jgi:integrase
MSKTTATRQRPYGSGSLRSLGDGRYQVIGWHVGRQVTRVFRAANDTEAEKLAPSVRETAIADRKAKQTARGRMEIERATRREWTVSRYADYYLSEWAAHHLADTTYRRYEQIIRQHVKPNLGDMKLSEVTETDLQRLYAQLSSKGSRKRGGDSALAGPTVWTVHNVIRALFTFAVQIQHDLDRSPAASKAARPQNVERTGAPKRAVDVAEVERFVKLAVADSPALEAPVMLSAYLGTRRSETLALRWSDIDYDAKEVIIQRSVTQTPEGGIVIKETTKTKKRRHVPLDAYTIAELKLLQTEQRQRRMRHRRSWKGADSPAQDWICATAEGEMVAPASFEASFRNMAERIGMSSITPHLLRHAFVSQLIALGNDAVTISAITGHSPDVLLKNYAHAFDKRKREAVDRLGEAREAARSAAGA